MEMHLTHHAKQRIQERGIGMNEVELTINQPDIYKASGKRIIMVKYIKDKRLEVVTVRENDKLIIITAYYAS